MWAPFLETFGQIEAGMPLIMKDDYGRVEIAINQDSFVSKYPADIGEEVLLEFEPEQHYLA